MAEHIMYRSLQEQATSFTLYQKKMIKIEIRKKRNANNEAKGAYNVPRIYL